MKLDNIGLTSLEGWLLFVIIAQFKRVYSFQSSHVWRKAACDNLIFTEDIIDSLSTRLVGQCVGQCALHGDRCGSLSYSPRSHECYLYGPGERVMVGQFTEGMMFYTTNYTQPCGPSTLLHTQSYGFTCNC